ncbi:MAG: arginine--tRNA ligase [Proteobacteria bacterium]|nr:arginine--tRNA ligase [Pseudomonadota bacterium]
MQEHIQSLISQALDSLVADKTLTEADASRITIERTRDPAHGDFATNIALALAKQAGVNPRQLATAIIAAIPEDCDIDAIEIAGPGFINFFLSKQSLSITLHTILSAGESFGHHNTGRGESVQVEFVSANPTGPLHVGHGRGAAVGDSLCRLLSAGGYTVQREFYYNDAGAQIDHLARSVQARCLGLTPDDPSWPEDGYRGDYIRDVAESFMNKAMIAAEDRQVVANGDVNDIGAIREFAVAYLRREQDQDLAAFRVRFDHYFLESSLYQSGAVESVVDQLIASGHTYEEADALWLRTETFGDDKNRVMRKSEGGYTYFVPDVAYHLNKWQRGFSTVINEQGADHHSTITRVRAGLQALTVGIPEGWPEYVLHQMVLVMRNGEEVKLSKRAGSYVTLRDLVEEVGCDATRYFLVARAPTSQLTFDIDLALSRTNENPVYYIQYAHARICAMLRKLEHGYTTEELLAPEILAALDQPQEYALLKELDKFPALMQQACTQRSPHLIANYLKELAATFHTFYNAHRVLVDDEVVMKARVALCLGTRQVIRNGLDILGVSAPESM